ncbi:hypothetical protein ACET3Z_013726 [Daucus carota]
MIGVTNPPTSLDLDPQTRMISGSKYIIGTCSNLALSFADDGKRVKVYSLAKLLFVAKQSQDSPAEGAKRGRLPPPQSKNETAFPPPPPRKASPVPKSLELCICQLTRNMNENHLREIFDPFLVNSISRDKSP